MQAIQRLREQHEHLDALGNDLRSAVESLEPVQPARFLYLRVMFAQALSDYLAQAEEALSPRLLSNLVPRIGAVAMRLRSEDRDLSDSIEAYLEKWCLATIQRDWLQFRADTHEVINLVQRRTTKENLLFFPLFKPFAGKEQLALAA